MAMGRRIRTAALALALATWAAACEGPPAAEAARSPVEQLLLDSLPGDEAAIAALPPLLAAWLDVRPLLDDAENAELTMHECRDLHSPDPAIRRRRLRLRLGDTTAIVLYAVADRATAGLERVEYVRRGSESGQRGLVWDRERDRTMSTWWRETPWGLSRRVERGEIPRGGPVPRALRGLGRQLLTLECTASADDAADPTPR